MFKQSSLPYCSAVDKNLLQGKCYGKSFPFFVSQVSAFLLIEFSNSFLHIWTNKIQCVPDF